MKLHKMLAAMVIVLVLPIICLPSFASGTLGTLHLHCCTHMDGKRFYFAGDAFSLVKIADAQVTTSEGKSHIRYAVLPQYKELDCNWGELSADESHTKAKELASVAETGECIASAVVDGQGRASFYDLDEALYLVVCTKKAPQNQPYDADPFLVSVPLTWEGKAVYTVTASPKYGWTPQEPDHPSEPAPETPRKPDNQKLPHTGQYNWPLPVFLVTGSMLILFGWKKHKEK